MITVHHLENSRSQRVLWLLEELGLAYEVKRYARDPKTMLRAYGLAIFGESNRETAQFQDVNAQEWVVLGVIAGLVIVLGFFPQVVLNLTDGSVNRILGAVQF